MTTYVHPGQLDAPDPPEFKCAECLGWKPPNLTSEDGYATELPLCLPCECMLTATDVEWLNRLSDRINVGSQTISLAAFIRGAWHIIEPGRELKWGWHLDAICAVLEAMYRGELRDALIIIPPGTTKSRIVAAMFPAWVWLTKPGAKFIFISNSDENATRDSMACRRIVESDWYQTSFRPAWHLQDDQNAKTWYETTAGGHRMSAGIHGSITGKKGDYVIVDDANDAEAVHSEAERKRVNNKYDNAISDRVNDFQTGCRLVVGQRTHVDDLIGHIQQRYKWPEMYIPEEFSETKRGEIRTDKGDLIWRDPRTRHGELLRPLQFDRKMVKDYKATRATQFRTKHNGDPKNADGTRFKLDNLRHWHRDGEWYVLPCRIRGERRFLPKHVLHRFGVADGAASAKSSADYTVMSSFLVTPWNDLVWIGCRRFQAEIPEQPAILLSEAKRYKLEFVGIESVASNAALFQLSSREAINVKPFNPKQKDKLARAVPAVMFTEAYRLFLPDSGEVPDFPSAAVVDELTSFTGDDKIDQHDDIVDTLSYAVAWLTTEYPDDVPRATTQTGVGGTDGMGYGDTQHRLPGRRVLEVKKLGLIGQKSEEIIFPEFRK